MAKKPSKKSTRQQFHVDGIKREWRFPTGDKRKAEFARQMMNRLIQSKKTNMPDAEAVTWATELDAALYDRLVTWGLIEPKEQCWTLDDLLSRFIDSQVNADRASMNKFVQVRNNLLTYFTASRSLASITYDDAEAFRTWLATEPLNERGKKEPVPYSEATVNRRTNIVKQMFKFGIRIGILDRSPMEFLVGGESVNQNRWEYVATDRVLKVLENTTNLHHRTTIALIRFGGLRGASELFDMAWSDIRWSEKDSPCRILVHGKKNQRHQKGIRWVQPIHPVVEQCLAELRAQSPDQSRLFPHMTHRSNPGVLIEREIARTPDIKPWKVPLYNLRKSFCCDMFGLCTDPKFYEYTCDHSYPIAMKHYQILHPERLEKGFAALQRSIENGNGDRNGNGDSAGEKKDKAVEPTGELREGNEDKSEGECEGTCEGTHEGEV